MRRDRIKICRIQSRICIGGPVQQTFALSRLMDRSRYETVLIGGRAERGEEDLVGAARGLGIRTIPLCELRRSVRPIDDSLALRKLTRILRRERPDIVHTHTAKAGALGRIAARACGVPVIVHTYHGNVLNGYFSRPVNALFRAAERMLAGRTDRLIALSDGQKRELCEQHRIASPDKISVIPPGLDLEKYLRLTDWKGSLRKELEVDRGAPLVGWVGRMVAVKDPMLFLDVCARIHRVRSDAHFVLVGDGPYRRRIEVRAQVLRIQDRVHLIGYRRRMETVYADLDLLVGTSINEGTPIAMIEAMVAGLPVVTVAVGGIGEILHDYSLAWVTHERSASAVCALILQALESPQPRMDGGAVVARFGADRLVRDTTNLYEALLAEKGLVRAMRNRDHPRRMAA